ncbi:hypothetical protein LLG90_25865 [Aromatoleum toluclasticum]|uniref:hypothetical protein n=1 Tax=Aromatoleum toluclasticum TaxID=92003 RepID=UPI001D17F78A|nr:hypothetical protein [Aromatoleum toluclasticum]MCC4118784.1 hypothetical protein [Aromatoleum toluclasticum]
MPTSMHSAFDSEFAQAPVHEWILSGSLGTDQKERLLGGTSFEQIIDCIVNEATLFSLKREMCSANKQFFRPIFSLSLNPSTVDLFHNSVCGYRAQYYIAPHIGERANEYALKILTARLRVLLDGREKHTCPWWWIEKSLQDPAAKLWIHQGVWVRSAKRTDRHLLVARWIAQQASPDKVRRKKAFWAALTPRMESKIEVKGGYLNLLGEPLGKVKPFRSKDLHELGFT